MKKILTVFTLLLIHLFCDAQVVPTYYYQFETGSPLVPTNGTGSLSTVGGSYTTGAAQVGNAISTIAGRPQIISPSITPRNSFSVSVMMKQQSQFDAVRSPFVFSWGHCSLKFVWPELYFYTWTHPVTGTDVSDNLIIPLKGINPASWSYYKSTWVLYTITFNAATGDKKLYIDGLCPTGFSTRLTTTGSIPADPDQRMYLNAANVTYEFTNADYDELAIYADIELSAAQVYQQYLDVKAGNHYSGRTATSVPAAPAVTAAFDINEFPIGHTLGSSTSAGVTNSATRQLTNYPAPRFKTGHTMHPNFNWVDQGYFAGRAQSGVTQSTMVSNSVAIQTELVTHYNYMLDVADNVQAQRTEFSDATQLGGAWVNLAKTNPTWKTSAILFYDQVRPDLYNLGTSTPYFLRKDLAALNYLSNASGFLDKNGVNTTDPTKKVLSPLAPTTDLQKDGLSDRQSLAALYTALARPLTAVTVNSELFPKNNGNAGDWNVTSLAADPNVLNAKNASGLDWYDFEASKRALIYNRDYYGQMSNLPILAGTNFLFYQQGGWDGSVSPNNYLDRWKYMRTTAYGPAGAHYSTIDLYPRWPQWWRTWTAAWRGIQPFIEARNTEIGLGDNYCAPFVSPGWDVNEEGNIRPAQWLGFLKLVNSMGAEYVNTGYFNEAGSYNPPNPPPADPKGYAWQLAMPAYSQGVYSYMESLYKNSTLLAGDIPGNLNFTTPDFSSYLFYSGSKEIATAVRQDKTSTTHYLITSAVLPVTNMSGGTPLVADATISLAGHTLQFQARRQGSVYYYDATNSIFYQLDAFHEYKHPERWSQDIYLEGEMPDAGATTVKTYGNSGDDYRNAYTSVSYPNAGFALNTLQYNFTPRTSTTYYLWIKARVRTTAQAGTVTFTVNGGSSQTAIITGDTTWYWYRVNGATQNKFSYGLTAGSTANISLTASSKYVEIDQILFTPNASLVLPTAPTSCVLTVTQSTSGPVNFCQGGSVTLTAVPTGVTYLWSTAATTASIAVTTSGTYTVTVTDAAGCSGASPGTVVTVTPTAAASVSIAASATTICTGTTVNFTATPTNGGTPSYQWKVNGSNVGTNSPFYSSSTLANGNTVTCVMTSTASCSSGSPATSNTLTMTVNANITAAVSIVASANPICSGASVTFTATPTNGGTPTYQWKKNGANVGTNATTYTTAGLANGDAVTCTMTSTATCVTNSPVISNTLIETVNANVTASVVIAASATAICAGTNVTFTATPTNGGTPTYQWKVNGGNVGSGGNTYSTTALVNGDAVTCVMTSTASCVSGSPATSNTVTMIVNIALPVTISIAASPSTTICNGTSVTFTATAVNTGATPTYQWKKNGVNVGGNSAQFITATLVTGDAITCVVTASFSCSTGSPATSNTLTMTVNNTLPVSVSITVDQNSVCFGTTQTFTAVAVNGGTPTYQWKVNGGNAGTNSATYATVFNPGDQVTCQVTSSLGCTSGSPATSNSITVIQFFPAVVSISISATSTTICSGTSVTFSSSTVNGGTPAYQWKLNGTNTVSTSSYTSNTLVNGDVITCVLTSNATCATGNPATSNSITMTVGTISTPTATISVNANTVCQGTTQIFTAVTNAPAPTYQWKLNSTLVGTNSATYSGVYTNGDLVTCVITTAAPCWTTTPVISNGITVITNVVPVTTIIPSGPTTFCTGGFVTLSANPRAVTDKFLWSNSATTATILVNTTSTYTVTVTSIGTCSATSAATTVTVNSPPTVPVVSVASGSLCFGGSVVLTSTASGPTYLWNNGATTANLTAVTASGFDQVVTTNAAGCSVASAPFKVLFNPSLSVNVIAANTNICIGQVNTTFPLTVNGGFTGYAWWQDDPTNYVNFTAIYYPQVAGTYGVEVSDAGSCTASSAGVIVREVDCSVCEKATGLRITELKTKQVTINWSPLQRADEFIIYVMNLRNNITITHSSIGDIRATTFTSLAPGTAYRYWIESRCSNGNILISVKRDFKTKEHN